MIYLTLAELLHVAERTLGPDVPVRDHGLLGSALARPQATAFGAGAYASLEEKAAALLHSLARNHALVDGNERLALAGTIAFASGQLDDVADIAARLRQGWSRGRDVIRSEGYGAPFV